MPACPVVLPAGFFPAIFPMATQKNYDSFRAEQFLNDAFFIAWVKHKTPEAEAFWDKWIKSNPPNLKAMREAETQLSGFLSARRIEAEEGAAEQVWKKVQGSLFSSAPLASKKEGKRDSEIIAFNKTRWVAAAVLLVLATAGFFLVRSRNANETLAVNHPKPDVHTDIAPGGDKAVLTLANGQKIILDSAANGDLSQQGGTKVMKMGGQLSYNSEGKTAQVLYNTISTPKGGQYQLLLADGTKAWLNAASSLRFPTAFAGKERSVELTGEGYFEVAHNAAMPFHVSVNDVDVQVLGTRFNINGYSNEEAIKTTLLEGRVMVKKGEKSVFLNPGQQAQSSGSETLRIKNGVDMEAAVAWKNGLFQLEGADVKTIGRQIERWYDVEVRYSGNLQSAHLSGEVPRSLNLSQVIKVLELSGIDVKTDGRTLTITPKP